MAITTWEKFKDLPSSEKVYLTEITALEAANPANTKTLYLGTSPRNFANAYLPVIKGVPRLSKKSQEIFYGRSMPSWGDLECLRTDGFKLTPDGTVTVDNLLDGTWIIRGQEAIIKYGGEKLPYSEYQTIFTGRVKRIKAWDNLLISIGAVDLQEVLSEKIVNPNVIAAGANVPAASVGLTIPVALGECKNVKPILIDDINNIYRVHDNSVCGYSSVVEAYDDGVALGLGVGYTDNADGTITLAAPATGVITCDIDGAKFGDPATYKTKIADIAQGLLETCAGFTASDIDAAYITQCNTDIPYTVGCYVKVLSSVLEVIDTLISGIPMWYTFTRLGKFRIGEFKAPTGAADHSIGTVEIIEETFKGESEEALIWRQIIKYDQNHYTISENSCGAGVTLAQKAWFSEQWREDEYNDSTIKTRYTLSTEGDARKSCLRLKADAIAVATKWVNLLGTQRRLYTFIVKPLTLDFEINDLATLTFPRFGLESGALYRLVGLNEDYTSNKVELSLWG